MTVENPFQIRSAYDLLTFASKGQPVPDEIHQATIERARMSLKGEVLAGSKIIPPEKPEESSKLYYPDIEKDSW